jgi:hypothetical protein
MRSWIIIAVVACACDAPGSSEQVVVDCGASPEHIYCQPDTGRPETQDAFEVNEATTSEVADVETTPAQCAGSVRRCAGNLVEVCANGVYVGVEQCSGQRVCVDGFCETEAVCNEGERRCESGTSEPCVNGQWAAGERCVADLGCEAGRCVVDEGRDCFAILECMSNAGCTNVNSPCATPCLRLGDQYSRNFYRQIQTCFATCGGDIECEADSCYESAVACYRNGTDGNGNFDDGLACALACAPDDEACLRVCINRADDLIQERIYASLMCRDQVCPSRAASCSEAAEAACGELTP